MIELDLNETEGRTLRRVLQWALAGAPDPVSQVYGAAEIIRRVIEQLPQDPSTEKPAHE